MGLGSYALRRALALIPVLLVVAVVSFLLIHFIPGDPAATMLGPQATPENMEQLRRALGLDRPLPVQFAEWSWRAVRGNLGDSIFMNQPVARLISMLFPLTLQLSLYALLFAVLVGVPLGVLAAVRRGTWVDRLTGLVSVAGLSMPSFWLGLNLIFLFSVELRWFPASGYTPLSQGVWKSLRSLTLPALSLGVVQMALIARMTRSSMLDVLGQDYVRTARAKGLAERVVVFHHALKNAMIPTLTVIGLVAGILLGGSVIIEEVFTLPGLGRLVVTAVTRRDYPTVQGVILFVAAVYVVVNLAVDLTYKLVDPRIKYGR